MEEPKNKFILLVDRVGNTYERGVTALALPTMATPTRVLRGELLEALPGAEQPSDLNRIALVGIDRKSVRLECRIVDLIRLSEEEANLLLGISSAELRSQLMSIDKKRLAFGRRLLPGNQVFVSVKGIGKDLPGVVWYKGELPSCPGTLFGVELTENPGQGKSDGTFKNKRYFTCPADSGVFVALDKLRPREGPDSKSPKRYENAQGNFKPKVLSDTFMPPFFKGKNERKMPQERINQVLEIGQRVVTFIEDHPARGSVRYIGEEKDAMGNMHTIVGLEMDERVGSGTGNRNGRQCFTCRRNFAHFVYVENLLREEDFDGNNKDTTGTKLIDKQDSMQKQIRKGELLARPVSYDYRSSEETKLREKDQQEENYQRQFKEEHRRLRENIEQVRNLKSQSRKKREEKDQTAELKRCQREMEEQIQLRNMEQKLREKDEQEENLQSQLSEMDQQLREKDEQEENLQSQLREMEQQLREKNEQEDNLQSQLSEMEQQLEVKDEQEGNLQSQLREMEQQLRERNEQEDNLQRQLRVMQQQMREKDQQEENLQIQLSEMDQQLEVKDEQEGNLQSQLREMAQKLREKDEQEEKLQRQLREMQQQIRENEEQEENLQIQLSEMEQQLGEKDEQGENLQSQLREMEQQLRKKDEQEEILQSRLREMEQNLREKDEQEENLQIQLRDMEQKLREKDEQEENLQSQLREMEQQLGEKDEQEENLQSQLREMEQQLREKDEQEENLQSRLREMEQQWREKDEQEENLQSQLREMEQQLREKDEQEENLQSQLREMEQQLREKDEQEENLQSQLREMEQQLKEKDEQEENLQSQLREMEQQLREKDEQEENLQSQLREMEQQLRENDEQEENLQSQLREMEQQLREKDEQEENLQSQLREMEQQLREKDEQEENLQRQLREMEQQLTNLQRLGDDREEEMAHLLEQVTTLEGQVRTKEQEVNELEISLSTAQQALREHQRQQSTPDWVISRDEIQLTDTSLGRGGWGSVVKGKYCGCAVAVKQIHELILSPHNLNLFEREMDIASRCRHPCLLLFIGATRDAGIPLFVTELMESSLRALLEQRPLTETEVSILSLDVSRGLSYLHQKRPSPIIHRDISSANVLLWRQDDQWRGKLSDYGTANFLQHTMTVAPGAVIYMAPEARTSNQTVKVDVYSFGVLLCEMCIQELPDPERRDQQIAMVTNRQFRALIRRCLEPEPEARPNMEDIFGQLEEPDNNA